MIYKLFSSWERKNKLYPHKIKKFWYYYPFGDILSIPHTHTHTNGTVQYSNTVSTDHPHTFAFSKTAKLHT